MSGYYTSALWIGHDNYKALASSSTGNGAAAPLWSSYMSKIHKAKGYSNRDILDGSASDYGVVKVTTCAVSGQLATEACENDAMGYGTVTDYWRDGTQPTVYCQMHTTQLICNESGMLAGPTCTNVSYKGVVTIPVGHPLYQWIGTKYESELQTYLGTSVTDGSTTCQLTHSTVWTDDTVDEQTDEPAQTEDVSSYVSDARRLLSQAASMLNTMDRTSEQYAALQSAIINLETVLQTSPTQSQILDAMTTLTLAMAGL